VLPQTLKYIDRTDTLVAVDSIAAGVELFDMNVLRVRGQPFL
jgi:DNA polymerase III epsilon subunit-like protein